MFSALSHVAGGFKTFGEGLQWLRMHPRYMFYLTVPFVLGLLFFGAAIFGLYQYSDSVLSWILFEKPQTWWGIGLYYICAVLLYLALVVVGSLASLLAMNVVASPIYEIVSIAVERDFLGSEPPSISFVSSLLLIWEEFKKVIFILGITILLLFIPGLNVISSIMAGFLAGWDFYDYPLARRGWGFRRRLDQLISDAPSVFGFGIWFMIPFVQILVLPLAVPGGTLLSLRCLQRKNSLGTGARSVS